MTRNTHRNASVATGAVMLVLETLAGVAAGIGSYVEFHAGNTGWGVLLGLVTWIFLAIPAALLIGGAIHITNIRRSRTEVLIDLPLIEKS